jgi:hypothetical protein
MITISLYTSDRSAFSRLHWQTSYTKPKHTFTSITTTPVRHNTSTQYLWCVNHYGPNNQLKDFIKCCIIALINNYTLIIPPLYPHYGDDRRDIQWFDHFYDLKQLSLVLNIITLDQFVPKMKTNGKKLMIDCYIQQIELVAGRYWYSKNTLISIQNYYKISVDFHHHINLSRHFTMNDISSKSRNCSSMFLHIHYTAFSQFFVTPNIHVQKIFEYLRRTALIQRMASQSIKLLPQLVMNKNQSKTSLTNLAVVHMRLGDHIVLSVSTYIKQILFLINNGVRFTHLHIMCPYLTTSDIKQLNDSLPVAFTTTQQLLNHLNFVLDGYLFDVLEQEIAYQAPFFIASPWTTYSATVLMQKVYQQKGTVYVFSTKLDSRPFLVTKKNVKYF